MKAKEVIRIGLKLSKSFPQGLVYQVPFDTTTIGSLVLANAPVLRRSLDGVA
ncbi:MAG: hypothetical protein ACHQAY_04420 [Hyphomicrobiales bacterium]